MICEEIRDNIKNFIKDNAKGYDIEFDESNGCKLTDIIVKGKTEYTLNIDKFNKKFIGK